MIRPIAMKLVSALVGLWVLTVVTFLMIHLIPGSLEDALLGTADVTPEARAAINHEYGLDQPLYVQYSTWLSNTLHGNLGNSSVSGQPVLSAVAEKLPVSLQLAAVGVMIAIIMALILGVGAAFNQGGWIDRVASLFAVVGTSVPDFVIGLFLIIIAVRFFAGFPTEGYAPLTDGLDEWFKHIILPGLTLALGLLGLLTRLTRSAVINTLREEYVRTARGKGLRWHTMLIHHVLKPSLIPIVTAAGLQLVAIIGGVVVVEYVFSIPGLGSLILSSIHNRDYPMVQAATLGIGVFAIVVSLMVDTLHRWLDPRVTD